uniref:Heat shock protein family A (Hsp70) member 12A.1 n=1 Tax=Haplochromis burtoni TaxID=8153 RepID=A0A3Q2WAM7_HAPBU
MFFYMEEDFSHNPPKQPCLTIDFGTAYSGYAFSLTKREAEIDPRLKSWGKKTSLRTPKTPTCILFDEHEKFLSFGYEAQSAYFRTRGDEARNKFFFECFKMSLYDKVIFLTFLCFYGLKEIEAFYIHCERPLLNRGGGLRHQLSASYNPVLTSLSRRLNAQSHSQPGPSDLRKSHYRVGLGSTISSPETLADCGTIDITVHEVLEGGALKELHKASGNDLGGQTVDKKFKEFLREIFSDRLWDEYEKKHPGEMQKMMYDISVLKENDDDDVDISCQYNLGEMAKEQQKIEKFFESLRGVSWNEGSIKISKEKVRSFFAESLNGITKSLREILKKGFTIKYILLVGGYSQSLILRQHITNQFSDQCKVLCPSHPQEAIMKGAVMFGRNPALVASRISAFTYGVSLSLRFDASKHRADKRYTNKEGEWCDGIFCVLVKENEEVGWDKTSEYSCTPIERDQTAITFAFYRTERNIQGLMYVDEWGVEKIGSIILESPVTARGMNREIKLQIKFGATEMTVTAIDGIIGIIMLNYEN